MATTRVQLNLKVPAGLREQVTKAAQAAGVSTNRWCEFALTTYLHFLEERNPVGSDRALPDRP